MEKSKQKQLIGFGLILLLSSGIGLALLQISWEATLIWIIGLAIGFVLQRANFCFAGGFLNFFLFKDTKIIQAIIIFIGVSTVGFSIHQYLNFSNWQQVLGSIMPWGIYTVVGGILFGLGMSLAGGCACSTLMRLGEGSVTFLLVVIGLILGSIVGMGHLEWWRQSFAFPSFFLPEYMGWFKAVFLQLGILTLLYVLLKWIEQQKN